MKYRAAAFGMIMLLAMAAAGLALWWKSAMTRELHRKQMGSLSSSQQGISAAINMNNFFESDLKASSLRLETNPDMIDGVNDLTFQMARQFALNDSLENLAISPISLAQVLWIMGSGAKGATAAEMASRLRLRTSWDKLLTGNTAWLEWLSRIKGIEVAVANALWHDGDVIIKPEFSSRMTSSGVEFKPLNDDLTSAASEINAWASEKTHGKISRIIQRLDPDTTMVVANAVYFKGGWMKPFNKEATTDSTFRNAIGTSEPCRMMTQNGSFSYGETTGVQWLNLPYKPSGEFSMVLALPAEGQSAKELITGLTPADYIAARMAMSSGPMGRRGTVELPRFAVDTQMDLLPFFHRMGLTVPLSGGDFSAISDQMEQGLVLNARQRVIVEVDEGGTVAAAVTAVAVSAGFAAGDPPPPFHFRADRPFAFFIGDGAGMIIFAGVVNSVAME